jgi:hypothetical protein
MEGDDYNPKAFFMDMNDTAYTAVLWQHKNENGNTIWLSKTLFITMNNDVEDHLLNPDRTELLNNYPNPFNPSTTIEYKVIKQGGVSIKLLDILGREIAVLVNEEKSPGTYKFNYNGTGLASGTYLVKMNTGDKQLVRKIVMLK